MGSPVKTLKEMDITHRNNYVGNIAGDGRVCSMYIIYMNEKSLV